MAMNVIQRLQSKGLFLGLMCILVGCESSPPPPFDVENSTGSDGALSSFQAEDKVLGEYESDNYVARNCDLESESEERSFQKVASLTRSVAASRAMKECVRQRMRVQPYKSCRAAFKKDPYRKNGFSSQFFHVLEAVRSTNDVKVRCQNLDGNGVNFPLGSHAQYYEEDFRIDRTLLENVIEQLSAQTSQLSQREVRSLANVLGTTLHEIMHEHGYHHEKAKHADDSNKGGCRPLPRHDDWQDYYQSIPEIVEYCAEQIVHASRNICGSLCPEAVDSPLDECASRGRFLLVDEYSGRTDKKYISRVTEGFQSLDVPRSVSADICSYHIDPAYRALTAITLNPNTSQIRGVDAIAENYTLGNGFRNFGYSSYRSWTLLFHLLTGLDNGAVPPFQIELHASDTFKSIPQLDGHSPKYLGSYSEDRAVMLTVRSQGTTTDKSHGLAVELVAQHGAKFLSSVPGMKTAQWPKDMRFIGSFTLPATGEEFVVVQSNEGVWLVQLHHYLDLWAIPELVYVFPTSASSSSRTKMVEESRSSSVTARLPKVVGVYHGDDNRSFLLLNAFDELWMAELRKAADHATRRVVDYIRRVGFSSQGSASIPFTDDENCRPQLIKQSDISTQIGQPTNQFQYLDAELLGVVPVPNAERVNSPMNDWPRNRIWIRASVANTATGERFGPHIYALEQLAHEGANQNASNGPASLQTVAYVHSEQTLVDPLKRGGSRMSDALQALSADRSLGIFAAGQLVNNGGRVGLGHVLLLTDEKTLWTFSLPYLDTSALKWMDPSVGSYPPACFGTSPVEILSVMGEDYGINGLAQIQPFVPSTGVVKGRWASAFQGHSGGTLTPHAMYVRASRTLTAGFSDGDITIGRPVPMYFHNNVFPDSIFPDSSFFTWWNSFLTMLRVYVPSGWSTQHRFNASWEGPGYHHTVIDGWLPSRSMGDLRPDFFHRIATPSGGEWLVHWNQPTLEARRPQ